MPHLTDFLSYNVSIIEETAFLTSRDEGLKMVKAFHDGLVSMTVEKGAVINYDEILMLTKSILENPDNNKNNLTKEKRSDYYQQMRRLQSQISDVSQNYNFKDKEVNLFWYHARRSINQCHSLLKSEKISYANSLLNPSGEKIEKPIPLPGYNNISKKVERVAMNKGKNKFERKALTLFQSHVEQMKISKRNIHKNETEYRSYYSYLKGGNFLRKALGGSLDSDSKAMHPVLNRLGDNLKKIEPQGNFDTVAGMGEYLRAQISYENYLFQYTNIVNIFQLYQQIETIAEEQSKHSTKSKETIKNELLKEAGIEGIEKKELMFFDKVASQLGFKNAQALFDNYQALETNEGLDKFTLSINSFIDSSKSENQNNQDNQNKLEKLIHLVDKEYQRFSKLPAYSKKDSEQYALMLTFSKSELEFNTRLTQIISGVMQNAQDDQQVMGILNQLKGQQLLSFMGNFELGKNQLQNSIKGLVTNFQTDKEMFYWAQNKINQPIQHLAAESKIKQVMQGNEGFTQAHNSIELRAQNDTTLTTNVLTLEQYLIQNELLRMKINPEDLDKINQLTEQKSQLEKQKELNLQLLNFSVLHSVYKPLPNAPDPTFEDNKQIVQRKIQESTIIKDELNAVAKKLNDANKKTGARWLWSVISREKSRLSSQFSKLSSQYNQITTEYQQIKVEQDKQNKTNQYYLEINNNNLKFTPDKKITDQMKELHYQLIELKTMADNLPNCKVDSYPELYIKYKEQLLKIEYSIDLFKPNFENWKSQPHLKLDEMNSVFYELQLLQSRYFENGSSNSELLIKDLNKESLTFKNVLDETQIKINNHIKINLLDELNKSFDNETSSKSLALEKLYRDASFQKLPEKDQLSLIQQVTALIEKNTTNLADVLNIEEMTAISLNAKFKANSLDAASPVEIAIKNAYLQIAQMGADFYQNLPARMKTLNIESSEISMQNLEKVLNEIEEKIGSNELKSQKYEEGKDGWLWWLSTFIVSDKEYQDAGHSVETLREFKEILSQSYSASNKILNENKSALNRDIELNKTAKPFFAVPDNQSLSPNQIAFYDTMKNLNKMVKFGNTDIEAKLQILQKTAPSADIFDKMLNQSIETALNVKEAPALDTLLSYADKTTQNSIACNNIIEATRYTDLNIASTLAAHSDLILNRDKIFESLMNRAEGNTDKFKMEASYLISLLDFSRLKNSDLFLDKLLSSCAPFDNASNYQIVPPSSYFGIRLWNVGDNDKPKLDTIIQTYQVSEQVLDSVNERIDNLKFSLEQKIFEHDDKLPEHIVSFYDDLLNVEKKRLLEVTKNLSNLRSLHQNSVMNQVDNSDRFKDQIAHCNGLFDSKELKVVKQATQRLESIENILQAQKEVKQVDTDSHRKKPLHFQHTNSQNVSGNIGIKIPLALDINQKDSIETKNDTTPPPAPTSKKNPSP